MLVGVVRVGDVTDMNADSADNWATKAQRRRTTGSGRCRYIKNLPRRFKNGFQEGGTAKSQKKRAA